MIKYLISLILVVFVFACKLQKNDSKIEDPTLTVSKLATEKYGDRFKVVVNKTNEFSLIINKTKQFADIGFDIDFFIYDHTTQEIILQDFLESGHVDWTGTTSVKAVNRKRVEEYKREKVVYLFDALTRQKSIQDK